MQQRTMANCRGVPFHVFRTFLQVLFISAALSVSETQASGPFEVDVQQISTKPIMDPMKKAMMNGIQSHGNQRLRLVPLTNQRLIFGKSLLQLPVEEAEVSERRVLGVNPHKSSCSPVAAIIVHESDRQGDRKLVFEPIACGHEHQGGDVIAVVSSPTSTPPSYKDGNSEQSSDLQKDWTLEAIVNGNTQGKIPYSIRGYRRTNHNNPGDGQPKSGGVEDYKPAGEYGVKWPDFSKLGQARRLAQPEESQFKSRNLRQSVSDFAKLLALTKEPGAANQEDLLAIIASTKFKPEGRGSQDAADEDEKVKSKLLAALLLEDIPIVQDELLKLGARSRSSMERDHQGISELLHQHVHKVGSHQRHRIGQGQPKSPSSEEMSAKFSDVPGSFAPVRSAMFHFHGAKVQTQSISTEASTTSATPKSTSTTTKTTTEDPQRFEEQLNTTTNPRSSPEANTQMTFEKSAVSPRGLTVTHEKTEVPVPDVESLPHAEVQIVLNQAEALRRMKEKLKEMHNSIDKEASRPTYVPNNTDSVQRRLVPLSDLKNVTKKTQLQLQIFSTNNPSDELTTRVQTRSQNLTRAMVQPAIPELMDKHAEASQVDRFKLSKISSESTQSPHSHAEAFQVERFKSSRVSPESPQSPHSPWNLVGETTTISQLIPNTTISLVELKVLMARKKLAAAEAAAAKESLRALEAAAAYKRYSEVMSSLTQSGIPMEDHPPFVENQKPSLVSDRKRSQMPDVGKMKFVNRVRKHTPSGIRTSMVKKSKKMTLGEFNVLLVRDVGQQPKFKAVHLS